MPKKLTAIAIANLAADASRKFGYEVGDTEPGLKVWVSRTGAKSFVVRYKAGGKGRKLTIGLVKDFTLQQARDIARETMRNARQGLDPAGEKQAKKVRLRQVNEAATAGLVENVFDRYISEKLSPTADPKVRLKSGAEVERLLRREIIPFWTGRAMTEVTKADVRERIRKIRDRAPVVANRTLANLRSACGWMVKNDVLEHNPCDGVEIEAADEVRRDRVLSEQEIILLMRGASTLATPWAQLIRLMLLTGVRRGEAAGANKNEMHEFNGRRFWRIPGERTKNGVALELPMGDQLTGLFDSMPEIGALGLLFTTTGDAPVSGFSKMKRQLDTAMLWAAKQRAAQLGADPDKVLLKEWHLHDIRRTVATRMAGLGVLPHIVEAVLNHVSGAKSGVAGTYNHAAYAPEKAAALDLWAKYIAGLEVTPHPVTNDAP